MQSEPLVSVVLPSFNRGHCLGRAMRSVLAQSYRNFELIVVDDGSTDNTPEVVKGFSDNRVSYVKHDNNRGAGAARNTGISCARGDLIAFQDSDDEWLLNKLELQVTALSSVGSEYGAVFGGMIVYGKDASGRYGERLVIHIPAGQQSSLCGSMTLALMEENFISAQTLLVRKEVALELQGFDERLPPLEDWDFVLRMSLITSVLSLDRPVTVAYVSEDSISRHKKTNALSQLLILRKLADLFEAHPRIYSKRMFRIGRTVVSMGKTRSGRKIIGRAIQIHPWSVRLWAGLALTFVPRTIDEGVVSASKAMRILRG